MAAPQGWVRASRRLVGVIGLAVSAGAAVGAVPAPNDGGDHSDELIRPEDLREGRGTLLARMAMQGPRRAMCFVADPTPEQMANIMQMYNALPPSLVGRPQPRFFTDTTVWVGDGLQGASGQAQPATLTISFPNDGVAWDGGTNTLGAALTARFGAGNLDRGRELIRQSFAAWERWTGMRYTEVADDNGSFSGGVGRSASRGDVRVGGRPQGTASGVLAYNFFPVNGSDMVINTDQLPAAATTNTMSDPANNYRYLRNVVSHEHGHGLGFIHPTPCNNTKLMEPFINTGFETLQVDEMRGGQRNYGDRFAGNGSLLTPTDFGDLTSPSARSVIAPNLSTNGAANANGGGNGTGQDWFRFTLSSAQSVVVTVQPTGGTYTNAQQTSGCNPTTGATVNALSAGDLAVELRNSAGTSIIQTASAGGPGVAETLNAGTLAAGTYMLRVVDNGPNPAANQTVQLYDLTVRVGTSKAPPVAVAGINKRIAANATCFFIGDANSYATDTIGATATRASVTAYAWDMDGDGTFESSVAQPSRQYFSNGVYPVRLRVTDSNGLTATDSINVTVFGAQASIASVLPASASQGTGTAMVINGVNFKGITSASQVSVAGGGVTVTGTPVVNALGTQITGLTFTVGPAAATGLRSVSVSNSDGSGTSSGQASASVFTVNPPSGACCASDGSCLVQFQSVCTSGGGTYVGNGVTCAAAGCAPATGACCDASGACSVVAQAACAGGPAAWTQGGACSPNPCPQPTGACCATDGSCSSTTQAACAGTWTSGGACSPNPCPQPTGACCAADGSCSSTTQAACTGTWTSGGACSPNPCPQPAGACCAGATCAVVTAAQCTGSLTRFVGAGSVCNATGGLTTPCCYADFDQNGQRTIDDIFVYLNAWFANSPTTQVGGNGTGVRSIDDIFIFLNAWFAGC